jgi:hypothetical protein
VAVLRQFCTKSLVDVMTIAVVRFLFAFHSLSDRLKLRGADKLRVPMLARQQLRGGTGKAGLVRLNFGKKTCCAVLLSFRRGSYLACYILFYFFPSPSFRNSCAARRTSVRGNMNLCVPPIVYPDLFPPRCYGVYGKIVVRCCIHATLAETNIEGP